MKQLDRLVENIEQTIAMVSRTKEIGASIIQPKLILEQPAGELADQDGKLETRNDACQ